MGLCNVPARFQTLMNSIFNVMVDDSVVVYLGDLLVFGASYKDLLNHLKIVLSRLMDDELYVGKSKCEIFTPHAEFLGLQLGGDGISVGENRKKIVQEWP